MATSAPALQLLGAERPRVELRPPAIYSLAGPAIELYQRIISEVPQIDLIASGGGRSIFVIDELADLGCAGVIIGKALYEQNIRLEELASYVG